MLAQKGHQGKEKGPEHAVALLTAAMQDDESPQPQGGWTKEIGECRRNSSKYMSRVNNLLARPVQ